MVWALLAAFEATTASEVKYDFRFEISDLNYIYDRSYMVSVLVKKLREEEEYHDPLTFVATMLSCVMYETYSCLLPGKGKMRGNKVPTFSIYRHF